MDVDPLGHILTQVTIWIAMGLWSVAMGFPSGRFRFARWLWTVALISYGAHIVLAYQHFYDWSHRVAWEATALDTKETTGFDSGVGLLVNFAFALLLAIDVGEQWRHGKRRGTVWVNGLVLFMVLNGAVVFGEGPVRAYGIGLLMVATAGLVWRRLRARESSAAASSPRP
ncbi:MAG: hypothetical protein AAGA96_00320 [Verrucomicrobiota bacterium]